SSARRRFKSPTRAPGGRSIGREPAPARAFARANRWTTMVIVTLIPVLAVAAVRQPRAEAHRPEPGTGRAAGALAPAPPQLPPGAGQGAEIGAQPALLMEVPQETRQLHDMVRQQHRVRIIQQIGIVFTQHQGRGRFRTENGKAVTGKLREDTQLCWAVSRAVST